MSPILKEFTEDQTIDLFIFRDAMLKMHGVYEKNPSLGDPHSIVPKLEENAQKLDKLKLELSKYEVK